jgi:DNA excision repair protein ERCC-5
MGLQAVVASVTMEMVKETQDLLRLFGLPFVISPAEAEAQCAVLEVRFCLFLSCRSFLARISCLATPSLRRIEAHSTPRVLQELGLVHGVVTDDSDVFLFGAKTVYKNMFESTKYAEKYSIGLMQDKIGLDRQKLVRMALLLGSDYTEGVRGVGIVNAMEILNAFPGDNGLADFKKWMFSPAEDVKKPKKPMKPTEREAKDANVKAQYKENIQKYRAEHFKFKHRRIKLVLQFSNQTIRKLGHSQHVTCLCI